MQYTIKAMTLGEILDQAFQLAKDNFKDLFIIVALLWGPILLITQFFPYITLEAGRPVYHPLALLVTLVGLVVSLPLAKASMITYFSRKYLGHPISKGGALSHAFSFLIPLVVTYIIIYFLVGIGFILLVIPGVILALRFMLAAQVILVEGSAYTAAMGRSWRLMRGNVGTGFALGFILGILVLLAGSITRFIPVHFLAVLVNVVIQLTFAVVGAATFVVFYFSVRCKNENFDLQILASELQRSAASAAMQ